MIACFWGYPSSTSFEMLSEITSSEVPDFIGMARYVGVLQCFQRIMERTDWANSWYSELLMVLGFLAFFAFLGLVPVA